MIVPLPETSDPFVPRPWGTYLLLALCVVVFVPLHFSSNSNIRAGLRLLEQATAYHAAHPYLTLDPRLQELLPRGLGAGGRPAVAGRPGGARKGKGRGSDFRALEQAELDGLTRGGFDVLARLPHWSLAVVPGELTKLSLVSHLFVHSAWLPLLGNLVFLFLVGSHLEARWRSPLLLGGFLVTGMLAAGVFILRFPQFPVPFGGASGAVAGLVGAYAVTFGMGRVSFRYWLGPDRVGVLAVPALLLVGLWGLREALVVVSQEALLPEGGAAGVAYWDHLAGLGGGLLLGAVVRFAGLEKRLGVVTVVAPARPDAPAGAEVLEQAQTARREGRPGEAWQLLREHVRRDPGDQAAVLLFWDLAGEEGRLAEAAPAMVRLVYYLSRNQGAAEGYELWARLRQQLPDAPVPAATEVRLGHALSAAGLGTEAQRVLAAAAMRVGPRELPMTLVTLAKALQGPERERIAGMALGHPDLPPSERVGVESLLATPVAARREPSSPTEQECAPAHPGVRPVPESPAELSVVEAIPLGVKQQRLGIELQGGGRRVLPLSQIKGVAVAQVYDGGVEPEYILDLVLGFPSGKADTPSVVRFHSERFDPRRLVPTEPEVGDALLCLAGQLCVGGARWLLGAHPTELRSYESPGAHLRELQAVLQLNAGAGGQSM